jgi:DNA-binding response OmpR family regulator
VSIALHTRFKKTPSIHLRRHPATQRRSVRDLGSGAWRDTQYLRVFIGQLRGKIERDPTVPATVKTEPGVGYRAAEH